MQKKLKWKLTITAKFKSEISNSVCHQEPIINNGSGHLESSIITDTELSYLEGATSPIQAQINNKQETLISKGNSTGNLFTDSKFIQGLQAGQNITLGQNINVDDPDEKNIIINADLSNVYTKLETF